MFGSLFFLCPPPFCPQTSPPDTHVLITGGTERSRELVSYLVVAVHGSSDLAAALGSRRCRDAVAKGEGLVAMVAGRVLERSLRGGVELQGTLGKESRSCPRRRTGGEAPVVGWWVGLVGLGWVTAKREEGEGKGRGECERECERERRGGRKSKD